MVNNPVHKVVAVLRRALQDSATTPRYIETIRKQGYRLIAPIRVLSGQGPRRP
jgi:DNA-binding winged helix-turn-helix (wHTH) protein